MNKVITISREYGAGGHTIGKRVAQELGIELYDKDIVRETVRASGYDTETVQQEEEEVSKTSSFLKSILSNSVYYPNMQDAIHDIQKAVILRYAHTGPCVILGRCADEILRSSGIPCLNVFIHAGDIHRAERLRQMTGVADPTELQRMITHFDLPPFSVHPFEDGLGDVGRSVLQGVFQKVPWKAQMIFSSKFISLL